MTQWFLKSIGVSHEILEHLDEARPAFQHPGILWSGLALLIPVGIYIFLRQRRNLGAVPTWVTVTLGCIRILILAMLVIVLSGPYIKLNYKVEKKPIAALMFDHSESMQLPAGPFEKEEELALIAKAAGYHTPDGKVDTEIRKALHRISRAKLVQTAVESAADSLGKPLGEKYDVRYYSFSGELQSLSIDPVQGTFPEPPNPGGSASHLGDAIAKVLDEAGGSRIAAILLFSDGRNTGGRSPSEVAHRAASVNAPIFAVPAGTTMDLRDVSLVDVHTSGRVALGDTARVTAAIESHGLDGKTINIQLLDGDAVLDSEELVLRGSEQQHVDMTFEAAQPGARYLTVNILPLGEELEYLRANNSDTAFVRVSKEKARVLYIDGLPRWDYRFLKNAIRRDHGLGGRTSQSPDILLEAEWRRRSPEQAAAALPATIEDMAVYHTVILGDVSPGMISAPFIRLLSEAVRDRGVGLIVLAGPLYMPHMFGEQLKDLLPIRPHPGAAGLEAPSYKPFRMELTPNGVIHEVMRLYDEPERNQDIWARMPPFYWCAAADRLSPGATVLAWNPDVAGVHGSVPLIAFQYAGEGKVLFVGTDSTWLWRQNTGDRFFYKFWGQAIWFVARRDPLAKKTSSIEVRPVRVHPGQEAQIELMAFTADGAPRKKGRLSVSVVSGASARTVTLVADRARKGRYSGTFIPEVAGEYRLTFDPGDKTDPVEARIRVTATAGELRRPAPDRANLELLAGTSHGKLVELWDLAMIPGQLKGETKLTPVHRQASLWDNWLTLLVLVFIYSLDVGLRRLRGLA